MYILINPKANGSLQRTITNYQYEDMDPEIQRLYEPKYQDDSDNPDEDISPLTAENSIFNEDDQTPDDTSQDTPAIEDEPKQFDGFGGGDMGGGGSGGGWNDIPAPDDNETGNDSDSDNTDNNDD